MSTMKTPGAYSVEQKATWRNFDADRVKKSQQRQARLRAKTDAISEITVFNDDGELVLNVSLAGSHLKLRQAVDNYLLKKRLEASLSDAWEEAL